MSALAFEYLEWRVVDRPQGGRCHYENVKGTSVTQVDFSQATQPLPEGFGYLEDLLDELESDPDLKHGLSEARREIAAERRREGDCSLATLRMAKGLSQTELADLLETKQPAVSRMESGRQELGLGMMRRLAAALEVDFNTLERALS
jgi:DNA-binding XRE family transcriptional regulator